MQAQYRGMNLIVPDNDTEWKGYFEAAREHRLVMKRVVTATCCATRPAPPVPGAHRWRELAGCQWKGTIHSYEIVMQAIQAGFRDWAPYPWCWWSSTNNADSPPPTRACA